MLQTWHEEDFPTLPQEQNIWTNWNLRIKQVQEKHSESYSHQHTPSKWIPLPHKMIQLNFDGSSKGKPSRAGYGGIFTDHKDKPLLIFLGSIGWDTNNSTELEGLWQGLLLAQHHGFFPLVIEGDCQILINMAKQILQGTPTDKVVNSQRLVERLELIEQWLITNRTITFKHIRREGNKVVDLLANLGWVVIGLYAQVRST